VRSCPAAALAMALAVSSLLLSSGLPARGAPDLLVDEGFENGTSDWMASGGTLVTTSARAHEGDKSAAFSSDSSGPAVALYRAVPIRPSAEYTFTAFVFKNDPNVQSVQLRLVWQDENGSFLAEAQSASMTDDAAAWRTLSITAVSRPNAARAQLRICVAFEPGGTVYADSVTFEGPPPLPATSTPPPTDTAAPELTPTVAPAPSTTPARTAVPSATPTAGPSVSLVNAGFEEADDGVPVGWSRYGGALRRTDARPRSGRYAGAFSSSTESTKWAYQTVLVSSSGAYEFSGYLLLDDPAVSEAYLRVSWYTSADGSGSAIRVSDSTEHLAGTDAAFRYLSTGPVLAPEGARSARLRIVLAPVSAAPAIIYLDDMSFQAASPEAAVTPMPPGVADIVDEQPPGDGAIADVTQARARPSSAVAGKSLLRQGESPFNVKINEVTYDGASPGDDAASEWLELYNAGSEPVDLKGWALSDNSESDVLPSLPLAPHGFVVVAASDRFHSAYPYFSGSLTIIEDGRIGSGLANKGDRLLLRDPSRKLADAVSWGDDVSVLSPSVLPVAAGHSIERSPPGHDADTFADFVDNAVPSPGRGMAERAIADVSVERAAGAGAEMSAAAPKEASNDIRLRMLVSLASGIVALVGGGSTGLYWQRRLRPKH
jgi:Lamin Tail Domain